MMILLSLLAATFITALCSVLHDGDYLDKASCIIIHTLLTAILLGAYSWQGWAFSLCVVAIFWVVFRRGWQAKAELTALNLHDEATFFSIVKAYPPYVGYVPMWITRLVVRLPFHAWHRRIQSGLIALLCTGPISSTPILIMGVL